MSRPANKGFTLIELLVVISIISLLAAIILASISVARAKGRDARRISDLGSIQTALEEYYNANSSYPLADTVSYKSCLGSYPAGTAAVYSEITVSSALSSTEAQPPNGSPSCGSANTSPTWSTLATQLSKYISLPTDPINSNSGTAAGYGVFSFAFTSGGNTQYDYSYSVTGDGQHYELLAQLEQPNSIDCGNNASSYTLNQGILNTATVSGFFDPTGVDVNKAGTIYYFCSPPTGSGFSPLYNNGYSPLAYGIYNR